MTTSILSWTDEIGGSDLDSRSSGKDEFQGVFSFVILLSL